MRSTFQVIRKHIESTILHDISHVLPTSDEFAKEEDEEDDEEADSGGGTKRSARRRSTQDSKRSSNAAVKIDADDEEGGGRANGGYITPQSTTLSVVGEARRSRYCTTNSSLGDRQKWRQHDQNRATSHSNANRRRHSRRRRRHRRHRRRHRRHRRRRRLQR